MLTRIHRDAVKNLWIVLVSSGAKARLSMLFIYARLVTVKVAFALAGLGMTL